MANAKTTMFPAGGHATLRMIDDLLSDCGVTIHENCGVRGCTTTYRYRRLRNQVFKILKFEESKRARGR